MARPSLAAYYAISDGFKETIAESGKTFLQFIVANPKEALPPLAGFLGIALFISIVRRAVAFVKNGVGYRVLAIRVGIRSFSEHDTEDRRAADWKQCTAAIAETNPTTLYILGAGGYETFGGSDSPLHDLIMDFSGSLRILLLKPDTQSFRRRCANLRINENQYKDWIRSTLALCSRLHHQHGREIEVRVYDELPVWKMIFTDRYLWLQHYNPNLPVSKTPAYQFQTSNDKPQSSLYYPFVAEFKRIWLQSDRVEWDQWNSSTF